MAGRAPADASARPSIWESALVAAGAVPVALLAWLVSGADLARLGPALAAGLGAGSVALLAISLLGSRVAPLGAPASIAINAAAYSIAFCIGAGRGLVFVLLVSAGAAFLAVVGELLRGASADGR